MTVRVLTSIPEGLLATPAPDLAQLLGGPTLLHLHGEREPALVIAVLLHGNEVSGWDALRRLLAELPTLPRSLSIFIGNVAAAAQGVRLLPDQHDFNRIWRGGSGPEAAMAAEVVELLSGRDLFAVVDLHNNTGHNPHYSVLIELAR